MLLMVFPSSSVLTAPQASVASPKADKHALNHMVELKGTAKVVGSETERREQRIGQSGNETRAVAAWWLCGRLLKCRSDVNPTLVCSFPQCCSLNR